MTTDKQEAAEFYLGHIVAKHKVLMKEFAARFELMKIKTRELAEKLSRADLGEKPDVSQKIHDEMERYDTAVISWLDKSTPWDDSDAANIAAGILIVAIE